MKVHRGAQTLWNWWSWGPAKENVEHSVWTGDVVCAETKLEKNLGNCTLLLLPNNEVPSRADAKTTKGVLQVNDVWFEREPAQAQMTVVTRDIARRLSTEETAVSECLSQTHPRLAWQIVNRP